MDYYRRSNYITFHGHKTAIHPSLVCQVGASLLILVKSKLAQIPKTKVTNP